MKEETNDQPKKLTLSQKFEAAQKEIETLNATIKENGEKVSALESQLDEANTAKAELETKLEASQENEKTLQSSLDDLQGKFESLEKQKTELESKEQDIEKRASARLAAMQAEIGTGAPLPTETENGSGKHEETKNLTGIERTIAALRSKAV